MEPGAIPTSMFENSDSNGGVINKTGGALPSVQVLKVEYGQQRHYTGLVRSHSKFLVRCPRLGDHKVTQSNSIIRNGGN